MLPPPPPNNDGVEVFPNKEGVVVEVVAGAAAEGVPKKFGTAGAA